MSERIEGLHFVLKIASRCNLNCSYCYVYNKGDSTWRDRPAFMSDAIFEAALARIKAHCLRSGQRQLTITFHGGEPCLAGAVAFRHWCERLRAELAPLLELRLGIQTNGTLLDAEWAALFAEFQVDVGVSLDGLPLVHNRFRVDHAGRGSYAAVERGMNELRRAGVPLRFLSVIQLGADSLATHRHLVDLGAASIDYLLPDYSQDTIGETRARFGETPCADYLIPIFDHWWKNETLALKIKIFWNLAWLIQGGMSRIDLFGNLPLSFLFVETDGDIEALDVLRVCKDGLAKTGLNVLRSDFLEVKRLSALHRLVVFEGMPLPTACHPCPERGTCGGGYLPHRYSAARQFDNPTVWCADLLRLIGYLREKLDISVEETSLRRGYLSDFTSRRMPPIGADRQPTSGVEP